MLGFVVAPFGGVLTFFLLGLFLGSSGRTLSTDLASWRLAYGLVGILLVAYLAEACVAAPLHRELERRGSTSLLAYWFVGAATGAAPFALMVWSRFWHGSARTLDRFRESTCASLLDGVRLEFYLVSRLRLCFGGRPFEGREALHRNDERSGGRGRKYGHALTKALTPRRCRRCTPVSR